MMDSSANRRRYDRYFFLLEKRADKMFNGVANVPICVNRARARVSYDTQWAVRINNACGVPSSHAREPSSILCGTCSVRTFTSVNPITLITRLMTIADGAVIWQVSQIREQSSLSLLSAINCSLPSFDRHRKEGGSKLLGYIVN